MTKFLLVAVAVLVLASVAAAGHRSLFGWREGVRVRVATAPRVVKDRHVERGAVRLRARGMSGGGCIGAVATAPRVTSAGCSGYAGPALVAPAVAPVPMPLPPKK